MKLEKEKNICKLKIKYKTRKQAWGVSFYFFKSYGWYQSPYKCVVCKKFHLTEKFATPEPSKEFVESFNQWFGNKIL